MKDIIILMAFIIIWTTEGASLAHAFYLQESVELSSSQYSPYPPVLSQPVGILPQGSVTINVGGDTYYYCSGTFYQLIMRDQKYVAVPPPVGAIVFNIPDGYQYMFINGVSYYVYQGVYYKRELDGYKVISPPV